MAVNTGARSEPFDVLAGKLMFGMLARIFCGPGGSQEDEMEMTGSQNPRYLPFELVVAIEAAEVFWRPSRADDDDAMPVVRIVGIGNWVFVDIADTAGRVARAFPDLPLPHCRRAAKLIAAQIGVRNRQAFNRRRSRVNPYDPCDPLL